MLLYKQALCILNLVSLEQIMYKMEYIDGHDVISNMFLYVIFGRRA